MTLRASFDDGVNWIVEAELPNTGSYRWTTPNAASDRVRLQIMTIYTVDETGVVPDPVRGQRSVRDHGVTGVTITTAEFALRPANPLVGGRNRSDSAWRRHRPRRSRFSMWRSAGGDRTLAWDRVGTA